MSAEQLKFPQRQLTAVEVNIFHRITGIPQPDRQHTISFLRGGQDPIKRNTRMLRLMSSSMAHTLEEIGANSVTAQRLFSSGALLVSSVCQFVNGEPNLYIDDGALTTMEEKEILDLVLDGPEVLKEQSNDIYRLLDRLLPVLDPGDEPKELIYIGASAVHQVLLESQRLIPPIPAQLAAYEVDESLRDLSDLFKNELG